MDLSAASPDDGTVDQIIDEVLAFPHKQSSEDLRRVLDAFLGHDTCDRLAQIATPTLVLAVGRDTTSRPELCGVVGAKTPASARDKRGLATRCAGSSRSSNAGAWWGLVKATAFGWEQVLAVLGAVLLG